MKSPFHWVLILVCSLGLSSFSVIMAMSGEIEPDMKYLEPGTSKEEVESQFGASVDSVKQNGHVVDTYEYEIGDPPDSRRGMAHLAIDFYSIFIYEFYATPNGALLFCGGGLQGQGHL
jgi:hypothetical protein